jgi:hypothetical protein
MTLNPPGHYQWGVWQQITNQSEKGALFEHVENVRDVSAGLLGDGAHQRDVVQVAEAEGAGLVVLADLVAAIAKKTFKWKSYHPSPILAGFDLKTLEWSDDPLSA